VTQSPSLQGPENIGKHALRIVVQRTVDQYTFHRVDWVPASLLNAFTKPLLWSLYCEVLSRFKHQHMTSIVGNDLTANVHSHVLDWRVYEIKVESNALVSKRLARQRQTTQTPILIKDRDITILELEAHDLVK
jgi:hypothetical protein